MSPVELLTSHFDIIHIDAVTDMVRRGVSSLVGKSNFQQPGWKISLAPGIFEGVSWGAHGWGRALKEFQTTELSVRAGFRAACSGGCSQGIETSPKPSF